MSQSAFQARPAERQRLKARIGLVGPSGSGKTVSGLLILRGLVGSEGRIAVLDTEQESSVMYARLPGLATKLQPTGFDVVPFDPPYSPQRYMTAIDYVASLGYDGLLVDQASHAWAGPGGVLEYVDNAKFAGGGAKGFNAWKDATPVQWAFVEKMLRFPGHIIVNLRQKVEWVVDRDEKGRSAPRKVGLSPIQREGLEYEFQIMLDLTTEGNLASVSKDRTGQVFGTVFLPTVETGQKIAAFLESGEAVAVLKPAGPVAVPPPVTPAKTKTVVKGKPAEAQAAVEKAAAPDPAVQSADGNPEGAGDPPVPVIQPSQAKLLVAAAKNAGMSLADLKATVKRIAGVEASSEIPASKFNEILAAVVPPAA